MKRTRLGAKRAKPRRTFNPIRLQDGSVKRAEYRVGVDLRRLAAGRECQVRIFGRCTGNAETTVLAHFRMLPFNGTGMKPADWLGAWACSACHDFVDHRSSSLFMSTTERRLAFAEGVFRTLAKLIEEGHIEVARPRMPA